MGSAPELKLATDIARLPPLAARAIQETFLQDEKASLHLERKAFQLLFATEARRELNAFIGKRRLESLGR